MLKTSHLERIANIGGLACEGYQEERLPELLLSEFEDLLGASGSIYYEMNGSKTNPSFGRTIHRGLEGLYADLYAEHYCASDPCLSLLNSSSNSSTLSLATTIDAIERFSEYEESEYYRDFLFPQSIHSSVIFYISDDSGLLALFGFQRPKTVPPFDDSSKLLIQAAASPVTQALSKRRHWATNLELPQHELSGLTPRQMDVSKLILGGLNNSEIAAELNISLKTVEHHIGHIYSILNERNRVSLALKLSRMEAFRKSRWV